MLPKGWTRFCRSGQPVGATDDAGLRGSDRSPCRDGGRNPRSELERDWAVPTVTYPKLLADGQTRSQLPNCRQATNQRRLRRMRLATPQSKIEIWTLYNQEIASFFNNARAVR